MADTAGGASSALRPEIARSWQRAELAGLHPASEGRPTIGDVDVSSRLVVAAGPVLRELAENIDGNTFSLLLTDRACRIVHRWGGDRWFRNMLDDSGIRIGVGLDETAFGTNATGTAMEIGTPVVVHGAEHYLHQFKVFSCYGHPVRHPLTHRIEGVLDITSVGPVSNPLFGPLVQRAARDIESRILDGAREVERRLFLAFQRATRHRYVPVAVLGGDVVLANRACLDLLGAADPSVLRAVLPEVTTRGSTARELDLGRLGRIPVRAERIDGTLDGAVFRLGDRLPPDPVTSGGTPSTNSGCEREWAAQLVGLAARHSGVVVIDDVHVLSEALCTVLRRVMAPARARVVLTSCPVDELPTHVARVARAVCATDRATPVA